MEPLTDRAREILAFESRVWVEQGHKEEAIRRTFGMSTARYYQLVNALIDSPAALEASPMLVKRLQRLRAERLAARAAHRFDAAG